MTTARRPQAGTRASSAATQVSLATNACSLDADRLRLTVPHWLRAFGERIAEIVIVLDPTPPVGRIAVLHGGEGSLDEVRGALDELRRLDSCVRVKDMPTGAELSAILGRWFGRARPMRCQAGTPIAAFVAAFDLASGPIVLRADCDMLFHENGWLGAAVEQLRDGHLDLIAPARCGGEPAAVSTRALLLDKSHWASAILPIHAGRLGWLRRAHRRWHGRPPWLALEQMLEKERQSGKVRFADLPESLGCSLHVARRDEATLPVMPSIVAAMEAGAIPASQRAAGMNFDARGWPAGFPADERAASVA